MNKNELVNSLLNKAGELLHVPAGSLDPTEPIWNYFPKHGRKEPRVITEFYTFVADYYKVYLTEREWENPTTIRLAELIIEKTNDPQGMLRSIRKECRDIKKGSLWAVGFSIAVPLMLFITDSKRGPKIPLLMALLFFVLFGLIYFLEFQKWLRQVRSVLKHFQLHL